MICVFLGSQDIDQHIWKLYIWYHFYSCSSCRLADKHIQYHSIRHGTGTSCVSCACTLQLAHVSCQFWKDGVQRDVLLHHQDRPWWICANQTTDWYRSLHLHWGNMAVAGALPKTDFDRGDVAVVGAIKELLRCMSSELYFPFFNNDSFRLVWTSFVQIDLFWFLFFIPIISFIMYSILRVWQINI